MKYQEGILGTMSDTRRCPYCGEMVPSFSLTCPKCYHQIPREEERGESRDSGYRILDDDRAPAVHTVNHKVVLILGLIPSLFGLWGLGQIYQRDYGKGLMFLVMGLALMGSMVLVHGMSGALGTIGFVATLIMYIGGYLFQAFDAVVRSLFTIRVF